MREGTLFPDLFMSAAFGDREKEACEIARDMGIEPEVLVFALTRLAGAGR